MKELEAIEQRLKPLFEDNSPQVWLGDYNRLYLFITIYILKSNFKGKVIFNEKIFYFNVVQ